MKKFDKADDEMATEYDFSKGIRGKYTGRFPSGGKVVVVAPDVADRFPNSTAVNRALRRLIKLLKRAPARAKTGGKRKRRGARTSAH